MKKIKIVVDRKGRLHAECDGEQVIGVTDINVSGGSAERGIVTLELVASHVDFEQRAE